MGDLLELLDFILNIGQMYSAYGIKGCVLLALALVAIAILGVIGLIALARPPLAPQ
jgi:hypothetical protein